MRIEILDEAEAALIEGFHFYERQEIGLGWYFLDSAPAVILRAAAERTHRIRLTSAVTVLSAADPVRSRRRPDHHRKTWPVGAVIVPSPVTLDIVRR